MNTTEILSYEMLLRVKDFSASRTADFPAASRAGQLFAEVAAVVAELSNQAAAQSVSAGGALASSAAKARLRASLREDLRALILTARVITAGNPDLRKKFRLPKPGDQQLLNAARAFLQEAEPLAAEFPKHEIPPEVLVKFKSDIDSFQAAISERNQTREARVQATARLGILLSRGLKAAQNVDVIVRNKFRTDKASLSAWESASHIEHNNGKSRETPEPDQGTTDTVKPKSSGATAAR